MSRLIDADALVAHFRKTKIDEVFPNWKELFPSTQAAIIRLTTKYRAIVLSAPTVDAVPVVRCKDCRWFDKTGFEEYNAPEEDLSLHIGWCKSWRKGTQACVFCSYGERKADG